MDTPRRHNAGTLAVGVSVNPLMVIPPNLDNFDIYGVCDSSCTSPVSIETILLYTHSVCAIHMNVCIIVNLLVILFV